MLCFITLCTIYIYQIYQISTLQTSREVPQAIFKCFKQTCIKRDLFLCVLELEWRKLNKYQRNQIKSCQSEIHRKYFQLSFLAVRLAGTALINPHRNNVPRGQELAKVSSPHFMKTGIIQSRGFTANMWAAAKGQRSRDSRRQPSQTRRRGKHWEERKEKRGKSGRSDC